MMALIAAGCATTYEGPTTLREAQQPAWSLNLQSQEMKVAVSPAGRTLRVAGSAGLIVGTLVDANVNSTHARRIQEALGDFDTSAYLRERIEAALTDHLAQQIEQVQPFTGAAGYAHIRDARKAHRRQLARDGHDLLLQLESVYGVFGAQGAMIVKIQGDLEALPSGRTLWEDSIIAASGPILASDELGNPTSRLAPDISGGLTVDEEAMNRWTANEGALLRKRYTSAAEGAAAALVVSLGLAEEPLGRYYLGRDALLRKKYDEAQRHFEAALQRLPEDPAILNAHAATAARQGDISTAIESTRTLVERFPEYGPAWFNLAWWQAVERENVEEARSHYRKALAYGVRPNEKLDELLNPDGS
jgi:tetratricopeptide (TPR) repeat protein